jgi:hypothetical protein
MKAKFLIFLAIFLSSQIGQAFACATCMGAPGSKSSEHMAVAVWFMMGAVMSVLGGVGAFGVHLWRHSNTPLEPHQELAQEDFEKYD